MVQVLPHQEAFPDILRLVLQDAQAYTWSLHFPQDVKLVSFMHLNILLDHELLKSSFSSLSSWTCGLFNRGNHCVQRNDAEMHCLDLTVTYISFLSPIGPLHVTCFPIFCYWRFLKCAIPGLSK